MVPCYFVALPAPLRRALDDVHARPVVALHVEVAGRERGGLSRVQVSRDGERLEKNLRHDHRASQIEHDAAIVQRGQRRGETPEIAVARLPDRGAVRGRMLVDDLGTEGGVNAGRNPAAVRAQKYRQLGVRQGEILEGAGYRFSHPPAVSHAGDDGLVHPTAGFLRHAEGAIHQSASDILRGGAEAGDLVVVNRGGAIHREVSDHAALHELDQKRSETGLHDMAAQHGDDSALVPGSVRDGVDDAQEITRDQNVGQSAEECGEAAIGSGRRGEFRGRDLVRPSLDWNGADLGQVSLRHFTGSPTLGLSPRLRCAGAAVTA